MSNTKESPRWASIVWPIAMWISIGIAIAVLDMSDWLLTRRLGSEILGSVTFGVYFFVLGVLGTKGLYSDTRLLQKLLGSVSVPKWVFKVGGTLLGLAIGALYKNASMYFGSFMFYALLFLSAGWLFYQFEIEIKKGTRDSDRKTRRNVIFLSSISIALGSVSLVNVWRLVCSCGIS